MLREETKQAEYADFVRAHDLRLRQALSSSYGPDIGREAAAEAFAYGWEHWEALTAMDNPIGYLYRVGQSRASRLIRRRRLALPQVPTDRLPWVEPGLPKALEALTEQQRTIVLLLHSYEWTMSEVAAVLGISKGTVQTHADRAMKHLRRRLKVNR